MRLISRFLATGLGVGFCPVAPATAASLVMLAVYWILPAIALKGFLVVILVMFLVGVVTASKTEQEYGHDASVIVIDELVGMLITVVAVEKKLGLMIAGFLLFRFFDILKPFPINHLQKLHRGWGIMADDVVAGVYANVLLQVFKIII